MNRSFVCLFYKPSFNRNNILTVKDSTSPKIFQVSLLEKVVSAFLIWILTYHSIEPVFEPGLDQSNYWALSYLFSNRPELLSKIVYPIGPLGFIKQTGIDMFGWAIFGSAFIRIVFITVFLFFLEKSKTQSSKLHLLLAAGLNAIFHIDGCVMGIIACSVLLHRMTDKYIWIFTACVAAAIGFYIKTSFGITGGVIIASYSIYHAVEKRNFLFFLKTAGLGVALVMIIGLLVFRTPFGTLHYIEGMTHYIFGYDGSNTLYAPNNWYMLGTAVFAFFALPFAVRQREGFVFYIVFGLATFALWKHGITRQDGTHPIHFWLYLILFFSLFFSYIKTKTWVLIFPVLTLGLFYLNQRNAWNFEEFSLQPLGLSQFYTTFFERENFLKSMDYYSKSHSQSVILPKEARDIIGDETVDTYPWDLAYIFMNQLNWSPRPTMQSLNYGTALDRLNADHFASENAPTFIIWHLEPEVWGTMFYGIDDRYGLTLDILSNLSILKNYSLTYKCTDFLLFKKSSKENLEDKKSLGKIVLKWEEWIDVPKQLDGIITASVQWGGTFARKIKSVLYKDEAFWIEYELENGELFRYRFPHNTSQNGIWISPFVKRPDISLSESKVKRIRFLCSNSKLMSETLDLEWNYYPTTGQTEACNLFGISKNSSYALFQKWSKPESVETGKQVQNEFYSIAEWTVPDTLQNDLEVTATLRSKQPRDGTIAQLCMVLDSAGVSSDWQSVPLGQFELFSYNEELNTLSRTYSKEKLKGKTLKVFVWNGTEESVRVRDANISIGSSRSQ